MDITDKNSIAEFLAHTGLFGELTPTHCNQLASVCMPEVFKKKELIFLEETKGDKLYGLVSGSVQLTKSTEDGREIAIRTIKSGETFAEVILFEQDRYPVTATALTECKALGFLRPDVLHLLDDSSFRDDFITMLMKKQRYLAERVRYLTSYDVEERLARFLQEQFGANEKISLSLSKKNVAAAIGTTPETLSRLLQQLKQEKLLDWKGKQISVSPAFWEHHTYH